VYNIEDMGGCSIILLGLGSIMVNVVVCKTIDIGSIPILALVYNDDDC
jgi:hypothetical protein